MSPPSPPRKCYRTLPSLPLFLLSTLLLLSRLPPSHAAITPSLHQSLLTDDSTILRSPFDIIAAVNADPLPPRARRAILLAAARALHSLNPHRFVHRSLLSLDPARLLRALAADLPSQSNLDFHARLQSTFHRMHDIHSRYIAPYPLNATVATTFFAISPFFPSPPSSTTSSPPAPRYVISASQTVGTEGRLGLGSEIILYDHLPVAHAVRTLGRRSPASNNHAQLALGAHLLTTRPLATYPFPDSLVIDLAFRNPDGTEGNATVPWNFIELTSPDLAPPVESRLLPPAAATADRAFLRLHQHLLKTTSRLAAEKRNPIAVSKQFQVILEAETVTAKSNAFGILKLRSFHSDATPALEAELIRLLRLMPATGLVLDIRGNVGGEAAFVKLLAELVSDKNVPHQPQVLRSTKLMSDFLHAAQTSKMPRDIQKDLPSWTAATRTALLVGEPFTGPTTSIFPVSKRRVQAYKGPVITLVDGLTYSAGDVFTALQVDQKMSLVVGTSGNVGAGGASTISYSSLSKASEKLFPPLPKGIDFTTAFSRIYRTGAQEGAILEYFGVRPDVVYYPTREDAVNYDCDLLEFLGKKLQGMPSKQ